ncbi:MAG: hypothetical protein H8D43_03565 [Chloroflexi bacterium]|nr:hypothetical protein [Chloroflexota bacterium]
MSGLLTIGLVGMPASGKTEASRVLVGFGFEVFLLSSIVHKELESRKLDASHTNYEKVARELRERFGDDIIARRAVERLRDCRPTRLCIDGIRNLSEVSLLQQEFPPFVLLAIHSSPRARFFRTVHFSKKSITQKEEFDWRDIQNLKLGIGDVIALADFMVVHDHHSLDEFKRDISRTLNEILRFISG